MSTGPINTFEWFFFLIHSIGMGSRYTWGKRGNSFYSMSWMSGTVLCASHMIFHFLPLDLRGMHSCPHFQMGKSRFRDVRELAQLVSVKSKIGIQVHLTLKPTFFPPHQTGQNYLWFYLPNLALIPLILHLVGFFYRPLKFSIKIQNSIVGTFPSFRPSLETQNSRVTEEVYFKHFIWVSRVSRTLPD